MYKNTKWLDRVVDADTGDVIEEGTDQSAANFNNMEDGISDTHIAASLAMIAANVHTGKWKLGYSFKNCVITTLTTELEDNSIFNADIMPLTQEYTELVVKITMGGVDVTGCCYSDGMIRNLNVTGDVFITATMA